MRYNADTEANPGRCRARTSNPAGGILCRGWVRHPLASAIFKQCFSPPHTAVRFLVRISERHFYHSHSPYLLSQASRSCRLGNSYWRPLWAICACACWPSSAALSMRCWISTRALKIVYRGLFVVNILGLIQVLRGQLSRHSEADIAAGFLPLLRVFD